MMMPRYKTVSDSLQLYSSMTMGVPKLQTRVIDTSSNSSFTSHLRFQNDKVDKVDKEAKEQNNDDWHVQGWQLICILSGFFGIRIGSGGGNLLGLVLHIKLLKNGWQKEDQCCHTKDGADPAGFETKLCIIVVVDLI